MGLRVLGYRLLDWFRFTKVAQYTFYHGVAVQVLATNVTITATVTRAAGSESDGDTTFDVEVATDPDGDTFRHIEVTPPDPDSVKAAARALKVGDVARISGDLRLDPEHVFGGGFRTHKEIHPVSRIEKV